jgi:selenocysteine-specific elongation factor
VTVLPAGERARVRAVEVHDTAVDRADAGQRVALNLVGKVQVARGDVVVAGEDAPQPAYRLDVALEWSTPDARPDGGARVAVHHGTRETAARLAELGGRYFQLRLEQPLVADGGDRVVIRSLAPPDTLGGGVVLDPRAHRHGARPDHVARLERLRRGEAEPEPEPAREPEVKAPEPAGPALSPAALALEARLRGAGHEPPNEADLGADPADIAALRDAGRAVRVGRSMYAHPDAIADVRDRVVAIVETEGGITLARLRDELGTSRKFAQALLEHLDAARVTIRRPDDSRVLRRRAR